MEFYSQIQLNWERKLIIESKKVEVICGESKYQDRIEI
ncbi:hypothetical protein DF16_orf02470 [Bacillus thuringiensis serovar kurstaki str. YBT-1520]|nr:hypothetical protein DF16_orf02470 [Bacillus thuringiensis serovar kurstaki str. YBT-1520]